MGGKAGYDVQLQNNIVVGLVADYSRSNLSGSVCVENGGCSNSGTDSYADGKINQFATARARVGYAVDNLLIYATGGLAYADTEASISYVTSDPASGISASAKVWGWTIGGGAEMKLTQNISIDAEYLYADFGKVNYDFSGEITGGFAVPVAVDVSENVFRASLNYRF